jgi:hypothetical protein
MGAEPGRRSGALKDRARLSRKRAESDPGAGLRKTRAGVWAGPEVGSNGSGGGAPRGPSRAPGVAVRTLGAVLAGRAGPAAAQCGRGHEEAAAAGLGPGPL